MDKNQINSIKKAIKSEPMVEIAYLFGSQATGNITPLSDFDFAVQLNEKAREKDYFDYQIRLTSKLAKAVKAANVDVVILNSKKTPLLLKYNIIKDGKIIYCKNKKLKNYLKCPCVIPAKAGIHRLLQCLMDSCLRRNDGKKCIS